MTNNVTDPLQLELLRKWCEHERWFEDLTNDQRKAVAPHLARLYREIDPVNAAKLPDAEFYQLVETSCAKIAAVLREKCTRE